jgi:hypothetical protein
VDDRAVAPVMDRVDNSEAAPVTRDSHSSTLRLNVSAFCNRGCN